MVPKSCGYADDHPVGGGQVRTGCDISAVGEWNAARVRRVSAELLDHPNEVRTELLVDDLAVIVKLERDDDTTTSVVTGKRPCIRRVPADRVSDGDVDSDGRLGNASPTAKGTAWADSSHPSSPPSPVRR